MSEWANKGDLLDFIRRHYNKLTLIHWKVFFISDNIYSGSYSK